MLDVPTWPDSSPIWQLNYKKVLLEGAVNEPNDVSLKEIEGKTAIFPISFPINSILCKTLKEKVPVEVLERNINSAYPVLTENVLPLYVSFLLQKRKFGNEKEREFYASMSLIELVDRLLLKRPVMFMGAGDNYLLLNGKKGFGINKLSLDECLSYDEIKLSAFLSVSSYSYFINDGNRHNMGVFERSNVEEEGIVVGLIGARFEKPKVMEYQDIIISKDQNTQDNGYGNLFVPTFHSVVAGFYEGTSFTFDEVLPLVKQQPNRFIEIEPGVIFDKNTYCKRLSLSFDTLLLEANGRAQEKNTTAFVHVVGIGLGVWKLTPIQNSLFLDTFAQRIKVLGSSLYSTSDIIFAHFGKNTSSGGFKNGDVIPIEGHPKYGIKIQFNDRHPHTKLTGEDQGKLLVVSYAWDGNALPGNEFWIGSLAGSGDPAQACSSQIAEIHNPHINAKVSGSNLKIATRNGLVSVSTYRKNVAEDITFPLPV